MDRRFALLFILAGCAAHDPYELAPSASFATWSPLQGNHLISSRFCETLLPSSFGTGALSLAELIDIGLQNNPSTKQTWAEARAAAGQYGQSLSAYYPNIEFDGSYMRQRLSYVISDSPLITYYQTTTSPDVTVTYTLFDFGVRSSAADMAREALYAADWTHNQQIQIVIEAVMNDYYNYLYQRAILHSDEANLKNAQTTLDAANQRFALGLAALGDVAQARTQYLQSKIDLTNQKQLVENAFAQLAVDIGLPANVPFEVQTMPDQMATDPILESVDQMVAIAQKQRQDFLSTQANVRSKEAGVANAVAQMYPVVNGSFDIGRAYYNQNRHEKYHFTAEVNLTFPLFAGFYYRNGVRIAQANLELARAQMLQTELGVVQNVSTSHMNVKTSALNLRYSDEYLDAAELEFDIALKTYKAGTATILDVMSAQSSLADARSKKAGAQYQWYSSLAALAYATGSLCARPCSGGACP